MKKDSNQYPISGVGDAYESIRQVIEKARGTAYRAVNFIMVAAYWNIGKIIVEEEQKGKSRADYGACLLKGLSAKLTKEYGRGFDESNLRYIRLFYLAFPKCDALRHELSWTHYRTLLHVENKQARNFYLIECINTNWNTRELERQINTLLYERLALLPFLSLIQHYNTQIQHTCKTHPQQIRNKKISARLPYPVKHHNHHNY